MKKLILIVCIGVIVFLFGSKVIGNTSDAKIIIGESTKFSEDEINDGVSCVKRYFTGFTGCKLTRLEYNEKISNKDVDDYFKYSAGMEQNIDPKDVIIFTGDFNVGKFVGDSTLEPNSTYEDWSWILVRDSKTGKWKVNDMGY